jgi:cytochrome P450
MTLPNSKLIPMSAPLPPKTRRLPLVGSIPYLIPKKMDFLFEERSRLGDVFRLDAGLVNMVILAHPRHAQHVLRDNAKNYDKGNAFYSAMRGIAGEGLATTNNWGLWLRQRRMIQPHFHRTRLEEMAVTMVKAIDEVEADLAPFADSGRPLNFANYFARVAMTIIIQTMFGANLKAEDAEHLEHQVAATLDYALPATLTNDLPGWIPIPGRKNFRKNLAAIDDHIYKVIALCRQEAGDSACLIGMLINMVDAQTNEQMSDKQLRDEAMTMFLAGSETTASILEWIAFYLNEHPEIKARAYAEVDDVLGDRTPTFDDLHRLSYLYRILQEGMRMRPPGYWLPRRAVEADMMDGYGIPKHSMVMVMTQLIHYHPEIWEQPTEFNPDRFLPEAVASRHQMSWIPFGSGQRQCIGRDFGLMEGQFVLARLMQQYEFEPAPGAQVKPFYGTTQRTAGVDVVLKRRA